MLDKRLGLLNLLSIRKCADTGVCEDTVHTAKVSDKQRDAMKLIIRFYIKKKTKKQEIIVYFHVRNFYAILEPLYRGETGGVASVSRTES